jgi:CubicO group peptidase (beta-lactamase class C family)
VNASDLSPAAVGLCPERLERITTHLQRLYIEPGKIVGCQTLVARRGQIAYRSSLGLMDRERERPMRDDTIFRIYSMSKPVASVALMMLYERGLFQLNDPIHRVIPAWRDLKVYVSGEGDSMVTRAPERPMTFRHILTHTSGLTYAGFPAAFGDLHPVDKAYQALRIGRAGDSLQVFVDKLAQVPLRYAPGERWLYSFASDVCGYLVEALSGQRFDTFVHEHILEPLGMNDTAFMIHPEKTERFAACYRREADKSLVLADDPLKSRYARPPAFFSGGGGLVSTTADYYRFCEMLRRGGELEGARILGPRTLALMTKNHLPGGRDLTQLAIGAFSETANEGVGFGLGLATTLDEVASGGYGAGDFYWGGMASTYFWVDPREDLTVLFMTQLIPSSTYNFRGQLKNLVYSSIVD